MSPDARPLADWLSGHARLKKLLDDTERLSRINDELRRWLSEPWSGAVRLARTEGDTALLYTNDASVSTLLRFRAPEILSWLRKHHDPALRRLQIRVRPVGYDSD